MAIKQFLRIEFLGKKKVRTSRNYVTEIHEYVINCKISINIHRSNRYKYINQHINSARLKDMKSPAKTQKYKETAVAKC